MLAIVLCDTRIDQLYALQAAESSLRRTFDRQRFIQAVGFLTRRRLPLPAATLRGMSELILASNPAVENILLLPWHAATRHISAYFDLCRIVRRFLNERPIVKLKT